MSSQETTLKIPEIYFTPWRPWAQRRQLRTPISDEGGVYILGLFEQPPQAEETPWPDLPAAIIYIGEAGNLNARPLGHHNALVKCIDVFGAEALQCLYASVFRVFRSDAAEALEWRGFTRYVEAMLDWQFTLKHGRRPRLHFKRGKDPYADRWPLRKSER